MKKKKKGRKKKKRKKTRVVSKKGLKTKKKIYIYFESFFQSNSDLLLPTDCIKNSFSQ